ncbi:hypothetical protein ACP4OV_015576 [Aristida adscensionis]
MDPDPLGVLDGADNAATSSEDSSGSPSPPSSGSPAPSSSPPSKPSAPPPNSSSSRSPPPSPPSPSQSQSPPSPSQSQSPPTPPLSPPPSTPEGGAGSPPAPASSSPSRASPAPPAPKHSGGEPVSSSDSESGSSRSGRSSKSGSGNSGSPPVAAIVAGVVIGVVALGLLMAIAACVCCAKKRRKRPQHLNIPYYTDQHGNVFYANSMPRWPNGSAADGHGGGGWHPPYSPASGGETSGSHGAGAHQPSPHQQQQGMPALGFSKSSFSYEEMAAATGGFSAANLLGQGGFGYVYKGVLAGSGKQVAIKQLKSGSGQGEREFQAEVEIISRVHHRHLVSLVGYCIAGSSQRLLVYEFVPNDTLEHHLHGKGVPVMDWTRRLTIALGSAKGLAYLHEDCHPRIIHRDIKAANILLDENFEAKVADFGLAKLTTDTNTHVSTRVMGTFGYLAPEYASSGKLTDKSDVFSFGVMLLELITGKRPVDPTNYMEDSLVDWARPLLARALSEDGGGGGGFGELVDPRLENQFDRLEMERMAACAAAAVRHSAKRRPKMKQIVRALEGDASLDDLNEGVKPGQSMMFNSSSEYDSGGGGGGGGNYAANINRFRQVAFESSEYSNEYSGTSEYGADSGEPAPRRQL